MSLNSEDRLSVTPLIVGITGGIGSGKSTVSDYLEKRGFVIIDADLIGKNISMWDYEDNVCGELADVFGKDIFDRSGEIPVLNRAKLAEIVFNDRMMKEKLDDIMLPKIKAIIKAEIKNHESNSDREILFLDAPLLFEAGLNTIADKIWVVDAPEEEKIHRVMLRSNMAREAVMARMKAQMSSAEKKAMADLVLDNSDSMEKLFAQIERALEILQEGYR